MIFKKIIKKALPDFIWSKIKYVRNSERVETLKLNALNKVILNSDNLLLSGKISVQDIIGNSDTEKAWQSYEKQIKALRIPDLTGGVNLGDRKAIFFIIHYFKPQSVLEIGTHIGASTVNIASALNHNLTHKQIKSSFSTLDIRDVNCKIDKPWLKFGTEESPKELLESLNLDLTTNFINQNSLDYLKNANETYDFIFLDGDHSAQTVYKEVPKAIERLNKGGVILLHDYFSVGKSANPNNDFNSGPYLGIQRHINEGANIIVKPFGELPWTTKMNSKITSLALLLKKQ
jgi:cephalosporin hydroxylase